MSRSRKCFSCRYCIQDCCKCLFTKGCERRCKCFCSYLLCLPFCDLVCHSCHKYDNCRSCLQSMYGDCRTLCRNCGRNKVCLTLECCVESGYTLEGHGGSVYKSESTDQTSDDGKTDELSVPQSPNRSGSYQLATNAIIEQPTKTVRFTLVNDDPNQSGDSDTDTTQSEIKESTAETIKENADEISDVETNRPTFSLVITPPDEDNLGSGELGNLGTGADRNSSDNSKRDSNSKFTIEEDGDRIHYDPSERESTSEMDIPNQAIDNELKHHLTNVFIAPCYKQTAV